MAQAKKIVIYAVAVFVLYTIIMSPDRATEFVEIGFEGISSGAKGGRRVHVRTRQLGPPVDQVPPADQDPTGSQVPLVGQALSDRAGPGPTGRTPGPGPHGRRVTTARPHRRAMVYEATEPDAPKSDAPRSAP